LASEPYVQQQRCGDENSPSDEQQCATAHGSFAVVAKKTSKSTRVASPTERIILGIDPGTTVMGFGVLLEEGPNVKLLDAGAIRFPADDDHTLKLRAIFRETLGIIERHHPDELAIEAQFFGKNVQSMLKLGRAQGVAIAAALQRELAITEYAPKRVKQSITGNGNATKEQVAAMLLSILRISELPSSTDATDAVAVAVCHHFSRNSTVRPATRAGSSRGSNDWGSFVRNNPARIKD
jgi:crossover junction endodeoxyribonuclease RuvC